jgi:hypothetical protein
MSAEQRQALRALKSAQRARMALDYREYMIIRTLRQLGVTWEQIAPALGLTTRQGAHEHYRALAQRIAR